MQKYGYYRGYNVDGYWGLASIREFARMMNGKYRSAIPFSFPATNMFTVGARGQYSSAMALQCFLNYYRFV